MGILSEQFRYSAEKNDYLSLDLLFFAYVFFSCKNQIQKTSAIMEYNIMKKLKIQLLRGTEKCQMNIIASFEHLNEETGIAE